MGEIKRHEKIYSPKLSIFLTIQQDRYDKQAQTRSDHNADYTTPDMKNYRSSDTIMQRLLAYEHAHTLNDHFLMVHFGTSPARTDKFYKQLPQMIKKLRQKGHTFVSVEQMIKGK